MVNQSYWSCRRCGWQFQLDCDRPGCLDRHESRINRRHRQACPNLMWWERILTKRRNHHG